MVVIQLRQDLFHDGLTEEDSLRPHPELFTIVADSCHLAVIQINDLSVPSDKGILLLFEILRIDPSHGIFLLACHLDYDIIPFLYLSFASE